MKKVILLLVFLIHLLFGDESQLINNVLIYKSIDKTLTIKNIKLYSDQFVKLETNETFKDKNVTYWLKIDLKNTIQTQKYVAIYTDLAFDLHTFSPSQQMQKFSIFGISHLEFHYDKTHDDLSYYFRLLPVSIDKPLLFLKIVSFEDFYKQLSTTLMFNLLFWFVLGIIMMAAIYNTAIYYYNREKAFLTYALMQFFIAMILLNSLGIFQFSSLNFIRSDNYSSMLNIFAAIFATFFTRSFLNTPFYFPKSDLFLRFYLMLLGIDLFLLIIYKSVITELVPYSVFMIFFLIIGFKRLRQGFKPALFYLIGWGGMILSVAILEFLDNTLLLFNPMMIGSPIEAIMLSLALSYKMKMIQNEKESQKELLIHQSKLAAMGEMIGNIAHQWRQPLTRLSYIIINIQEAYKNQTHDLTYLDKKISDATKQLEYMSKTIDDFQNFYAPDLAKETFSIVNATQNSLEIIQDQLLYENIDCTIEVINDQSITNYKNQYMHVILNILTNAKDNFQEHHIKNPKILIQINQKIIRICDNGGGITTVPIQKIFEPYFTTKEKSSGIGLYMSKIIIENSMDAKLTAINEKNGACFEIRFA
jgi:signal transduction histidine kinase